MKIPRPWNDSVLVLELMLAPPWVLALLVTASPAGVPDGSQLRLEPQDEKESVSLKVPEGDLFGPTEGLTSRFVFANVFLTRFEIDLFNVMVEAREGSLVVGSVICCVVLCCAVLFLRFFQKKHVNQCGTESAAWWIFWHRRSRGRGQEKKARRVWV